MIPQADLEPCPYGCGRHVLVTLTDRGRRLAVDPDPHPGGNQAVWRTGTGAWRSRSLSGREAMPVLAYEEIHMPHVATSPRCRPAPPAAAPADPCVYGCRPSTGWRWTPIGWHRSCDRHRGGRLAVRLAVRRGDFVPDVANIRPSGEAPGSTPGHG